MNREQAFSLIKEYVKNENSVKHMLAVEAVMRSLAERFNQDQELWGMVGLVHDIDMEIVDYLNEPEKHGIKGAEILQEKGFSSEVIEAIKAHNEATGKNPETLLEKAIFCVDPLTGLIIAGVLVSPSKKISDLTAQSVLKRFKEKSFARGANREIIKECSKINLDLEEFINVGLKAMKNISDDLGL
jgi:putative nucleotidyltransferase with HDIG domain